MSTVGTMILEAFQGLVFQTCTVQEGGRTSSINRLFSRLNGLMNLTPCNARPSCKSSVSMCLTPARCAEAHNIASQNANRCALTASSAAERSPTSAACTGITARQASIVLRMSLTGILALRIATLLNSRKSLQQQDARCSPHCAGDEVTRPHHLRVGYRSGCVNENVSVEADHDSCISSRLNLFKVLPQDRPFAITLIAC
jgi:hypothetical protein